VKLAEVAGPQDINLHGRSVAVDACKPGPVVRCLQSTASLRRLRNITD
jgi:hypothetical protein